MFDRVYFIRDGYSFLSSLNVEIFISNSGEIPLSKITMCHVWMWIKTTGTEKHDCRVESRNEKAPNLKHQPRDKMTEVIIFAISDAWAHAQSSGRNRTGDWLAITCHLSGLESNNLPNWTTCKSYRTDAIACVSIGRVIASGLVNTIGRNWQRQVSGMLIITLKNAQPETGELARYLERERAEQAEKKRWIELPVKKKSG